MKTRKSIYFFIFFFLVAPVFAQKFSELKNECSIKSSVLQPINSIDNKPVVISEESGVIYIQAFDFVFFGEKSRVQGEINLPVISGAYLLSDLSLFIVAAQRNQNSEIHLINCVEKSFSPLSISGVIKKIVLRDNGDLLIQHLSSKYERYTIVNKNGDVVFKVRQRI